MIQILPRPLHILFGGALIFGLAATDFAMGQGMRGHYFREAPSGAGFESAAEKTGFAGRADGKRHLVLIMVESLGVPEMTIRSCRTKLFGLL